MIINHGLQKIKHIVTTKHSILNPSMKQRSNNKLSFNKENENPNIKKSPSQQKQPIQPPQRGKQHRVKSQYYSTGVNGNSRQSPIKKILFVKNLCYKSTKTSKNSSLDNKNSAHDNNPPSGARNQQSLVMNQHQKQKPIGLNHYSERNNPLKQIYERKSYSNKNVLENESEIYQEHKANEKNIHDLKPKDMHHNESQAIYRLSMAPNQLHPKVAQFNQKYTQQQNQSKSNLQRMASFQHPSSSISSQSPYNRNNSTKMCPNIQSSDLSELQSFKKNNFLYPQPRKQPISNKALLSMDKEKKESLSSKKRNSRIKVTYKNNDKYKESFNEQSQFVTQASEVTISSPVNPLMLESTGKLNNSLNTDSERNSKLLMSKSALEDTLVETRKFNETLSNISEEFSNIKLDDYKQASQQSPQNQTFRCANHPEKPAKFQLSKQTPKPYYCSKCTVLLVTQGYKVISNLQIKANRLDKLKNFIFTLQLIQPKINHSNNNIAQLSSEIHIIHKKAQQEIEKYYTVLFSTLQSHKQNTIKALHFHSHKILSQLENLKRNIQQNHEQINFIKSDILPNIDLIVNEEKLPEQSFNQIIKEHEQKIENIDAVIEKVRKLTEDKEMKMTMKAVEIPANELKTALNSLQRTQIVFVDKILRIDPNHQSGERISSLGHNLSFKLQTQNIGETKRDFSFDDQNIDTSFYVPSSKKKNRIQNPSVLENFYELTDSVRLSFGNKFQNTSNSMQSPTFKAI